MTETHSASVVTEHNEPEPRAGEITGVNHLVLHTASMEQTVNFYCGVLGLKVRATVSLSALGYRAGSGDELDCDRMYFFALPDGGLLAFAEIETFDGSPQESTFDFYWPSPEASTLQAAQSAKMDHLSFNVRSPADLDVVRERLIKAEIPCSEIQDNLTPPFVRSLYTRDPNGIPIEFSAFGWTDPEKWEALAGTTWYTDPDPVGEFIGFDDAEVGKGLPKMS